MLLLGEGYRTEDVLSEEGAGDDAIVGNMESVVVVKVGNRESYRCPCAEAPRRRRCVDEKKR